MSWVAAAVVGSAVVGAAMAPDAPDNSGMNDAARQQAALSKEELDWYKQIYADSAPDRAAATKLAQEQAGLQNELSKQQLELSKQERDRYQSTFQPIESRIAADAIGYDTPARREAAAAAAGADIGMAADAQRQATMRQMERSGALPSSGRVMALQGALDIGTAKARVGAENQARQQVETVGSAKLMDAAGLGRGVIGNQGTTAGIALNAGNSAVGNGNQPVNIAAAGANLMGQGFQLGNQSLNNAAGTYGQMASIQQRANEQSNSMWGALGGVAGQFAGSKAGSTLIAGALSDENEKEDIGPASDDEALEAVRETPNKTWRYKEDSPAADGGQMHMGPMAQKVAATMGMDAAPGGKMIDLVTMNGITNGAVRALDKKVQKIAAAMGMAEPAAA